jgi:hypothetical protein
MGDEDNVHNRAQKQRNRIFVGDLKRRAILEDLNTDRTMILKCILKKLSV